MNAQFLEKFIVRLYDTGCIKLGEFVSSTGIQMPSYFDTSILASFPDILVSRYSSYFVVRQDFKWSTPSQEILFQIDACDLMTQYIIDNQLNYDIICGVPLSGLPLATVTSRIKSTSDICT